MKRNKRSQHQLQQTVKMKIAVIQQQKDDLIDILNDYTSSMLTEVEKVMADRAGSQTQYKSTLSQLDKVSQLFTNLASHMDSTLYADEDKESPWVNAIGDGEDISQEKGNKYSKEIEVKKPNHQNENSGDLLSESLPVEDNVKDYERAEDVKLLVKQADTHQQLQNPFEENHKTIVHKEPLSSNHFTTRKITNCSECTQELADDQSDLAKSLSDHEQLDLTNNASCRHTTSCVGEIISERSVSKKKKKNESQSHKTIEPAPTTAASLDLTTYSLPVEVSDTETVTQESKVLSKEETQSNSGAFQPLTQIEKDAEQQRKEDNIGSSQEYNGSPLILPSVSHSPQHSYQPVSHHGHIKSDSEEPYRPYQIPAPSTWAPPTYHHFEPMPGVPQTVPLVNTLNPIPRFNATGMSFLPSSFSGGVNFFHGQNLYHQLPLLNAAQTVNLPISSNVYNNFSNPAHLAQLMPWPRASASYLPQLNSLSAGPIFPPRHGVLVQNPFITPASPVSEAGVQITELERSRSSSVDTCSRANSTPPYSMYDHEVGALLQTKTSSPGESNPCKQACKIESPLSDSLHNNSPNYRAVFRDQTVIQEENPGRSSENLSGHGSGDKDGQESHIGSPCASAKPLVSFRSSSQFHIKKSQKLKDIPDDLKSIIKQAMQENKSIQENKESLIKENIATISDHAAPKDAKELQVAPLILKKDEIVVVSISSLEDPWAFHAQMPTLLPHILQIIQEAVESTHLCNATPRSGLFCLAKFTDGKYYRAKVEQHIDMGDYPPRLQVCYVDYGNRHWVSASDLLQLPESLAKIPAQSVFCSLAKVTPATDNWTERATELLRQLTQGSNVQMRIVHPTTKRRRNLSDSPVACPLSLESEPTQTSPTSSNTSSFIELPYLVDIIARQEMGTEAISVSSILVKAKLAEAVSVESQLETLSKINNQKIDKRFLGLQKMMNSLTQSNTGDKSQTPSNSSSPVPFQSSDSRPRHKRIPSCLQTTKLKGLHRNSLLSKLASQATSNSPGSQTPDVSGRSPNNYSKTAEQTQDPDSLMSQNKPSLALCVEVDEKLRNLGQAKEKNKKWEENKYCIDENQGEEEVEYEVVVTSVISPSSFFVQPVNGHSNMAWLVEGLNKKYGNLSHQYLIMMSEAFIPEKHAICCAVFSEDKCFYRGRILDVKSDTVLILFIDFGDFEWVPRKKVYPLSDEFKALPALALWCCLKGVMPPGGSDPETKVQRWSLQTIKIFKALVAKCSLLKVVVSKSDQQRFEGQSFQCEPLEVFLVYQSEESEESSEIESGTDRSEEELCLNYELIYMSLATVQPLSIVYSGIGTEDQEPDLTNWDPLQEDFQSYRNSYKVNTDDPGVALVGYEAGKFRAGGQRVCVFFNRRHGCFKGDSCPDLHVKSLPNGTGLQHDLEPVRVYDEDQSNLLPEKGTLVIVTVSTVFTPTKFFVTLPWGRLTFEEVANHSDAWHRFQAEENLEGLMDNMQKFYAQCPYDRDLTVLGFCEAIAARVEGRWIRAKVIDSNEDKGLVQVVSVDFGWEVWVQETELRDLELRFLHLPPQAVACSLAMVAPSEQHGHKWVSDACKCFADLVLNKSLVAFVKARDPSGQLSLLLYDTNGSTDVDINKAMVDIGWARTLKQGLTSSSLEKTTVISLAPA